MKITEYTRERAEVLGRLNFSNPNMPQIGILWFDAVTTESLRQRIDSVVHAHTFSELQLVMTGSCTYECQGSRIDLSAGQGLLIPRKTHHRYLSVSEDLLKISIAFFTENTAQTAVQTLPLTPEIYANVDHIFQAASRQDIFAPGIINGRILEILFAIHARMGIDFLDPEGISGNVRWTDPRFLVAQTYINQNSNRLLTCEEVASECGYSPKHLSRIFQNHTGKSLYAYIIDTRLKHATELLLDKDKTIKQVSRLAGFENESSFVAFFKRHYGITPGSFRKDKFQTQKPKPGGRENAQWRTEESE